MVMSLKERMQRDSLRKEQKRADRAGMKTLMKGEEVVSKLASGRQIGDDDLKNISLAVDVFKNADEETRDRMKAKLRKRDLMLYNIVETELRGEWMDHFEKLIGAIPLERRQRPFSIDWTGWREIGAKAGMPEEQVVEALKVLLVFRDRKGTSVVQAPHMIHR